MSDPYRNSNEVDVRNFAVGSDPILEELGVWSGPDTSR
jgi:hypothetical protein